MCISIFSVVILILSDDKNPKTKNGNCFHRVLFDFLGNIFVQNYDVGQKPNLKHVEKLNLNEIGLVIQKKVRKSFKKHIRFANVYEISLYLIKFNIIF